VTAFLVERGDAGVAVREGEEKLGLRTATGTSGAGRNLRDAIGMTISSGTSDMQRNIIAARLGLTWPEPHTDGSGPWPA
jgi:alkylation response protein AidB-like acyl-CoA dehydrogenase